MTVMEFKLPHTTGEAPRVTVQTGGGNGGNGLDGNGPVVTVAYPKPPPTALTL